MLIVGQGAFVLGLLASIIVQYMFYVAKERSQRMFYTLTAANFLFLVAIAILPIEPPRIVSAFLWIGLFFGLAGALFYDALPWEQS